MMLAQAQYSFLIMALLCGTVALLLVRGRRRLAEHFARISLVRVEPAMFEVVLTIVAVSAGLLSLVALILLVVN